MASGAAEVISGRLHAALAALADGSLHAREKRRLSKMHADGVTQALAGATLSKAQLADLCALASRVGWPAEVTHQIIGGLVACDTGGGTKRAKLQSYELLIEFLPRGLWETMVSSEFDFHSKLGAFMEHLGLLGLRNPSCPTFAVIASVLQLCIVRAGGDPSTLSRHVLGAQCDNIKSAWRRTRRQPPRDVILRMPISVQEFKRLYPATYVEAFPDEGVGPVQCPLSVLEVQQVAKSIPLRGCKDQVGAFMQYGTTQAPPRQPGQYMWGQHQAHTHAPHRLSLQNAADGNSMMMGNGAHIQIFGSRRETRGRWPNPAAAPPPALPDVPPATAPKPATQRLPPEMVQDGVDAPQPKPVPPLPPAAALVEISDDEGEPAEPQPKKARTTAATTNTVAEGAAVLLTAILKSKDERKKIADAKKAEKKKEKNAEAQAVSGKGKRGGGGTTEVSAPVPAAAKKKAKSQCKAEAPKVLKEKCKAGVTKVLKEPSISLEVSRMNVQYRSGRAEPGANKTFKYYDEASKDRKGANLRR